MGTEGFERGMEGSRRSARRRWTEEEKADVDIAIRVIALKFATFTTEVVWAYLGEDFPVSKGMTSRLMMAKRRKLIEQIPGEFAYPSGSDVGPDHGQRLQVWKSLVFREKAARSTAR